MEARTNVMPPSLTRSKTVQASEQWFEEASKRSLQLAILEDKNSDPFGVRTHGRNEGDWGVRLPIVSYSRQELVYAKPVI